MCRTPLPGCDIFNPAGSHVQSSLDILEPRLLVEVRVRLDHSAPLHQRPVRLLSGARSVPTSSSLRFGADTDDFYRTRLYDGAAQAIFSRLWPLHLANSAPIIISHRCAAVTPAALETLPKSKTAWSATVVYFTDGRWRYAAARCTSRRSLEPAEATHAFDALFGRLFSAGTLSAQWHQSTFFPFKALLRGEAKQSCLAQY